MSKDTAPITLNKPQTLAERLAAYSQAATTTKGQQAASINNRPRSQADGSRSLAERMGDRSDALQHERNICTRWI